MWPATSSRSAARLIARERIERLACRAAGPTIVRGPAALLAIALAIPALGLATDLAPRPLCVAAAGLHCFAASDLSPRWQTPAGLAFDSSLDAAELTLAAGSSGLAAYSPDGRETWRRTDLGPVFEPRFAAGAVYAGTLGGDLVRLNAVDGAPAWRRRLPGWVYSPALLGDRVVTGGSAGRLYAFDRASGAPLWTRDLGQELVYRPVEAGRDELIATTFDGEIALFDKAGERRWRRNFGVAARSPVVVGDRLYSSLFDGRVVALALADGSLLWQRGFARPLDLVTAGDRLVAYDIDGLFVLDNDGETLRRERFAAALLRVEPCAGGGLVAFLRRGRAEPYAARLGPGRND